jgi:DNA repair protein RadC
MRVYEASVSYRVVAHIDFRKIDSPLKPLNTSKARMTKILCRNRSMSFRSTERITPSVAVFRAAILANAAAIIVSHNHPSGDPAPSAADLHVTRQLREASRAIDITLLDHVIVGEPEADPTGKGFYSFREGGLI